MECESVRTTKARRTSRGLALVTAHLIAVVAFAPLAHAADALTLTGVATCEQDGTYSVVWTGATARPDSTSAGTLTVTNASPANATVSPTDQAVSATGPFTLTQTGIDGSASAATVAATVAWNDQSSDSATGSVSLAGDCAAQPATVDTFTPPEPTFTSVVCDAANAVEPSYTIPSVDGVAYEVNGVPKAPGTYPMWTGKVVVTAVPTDGRQLAGTTSWSFTFPGEDCAIVDPGTPPLPPVLPTSDGDATQGTDPAGVPVARHVTNAPVAVRSSQLAATGRLDREMLALGLLSLVSGAVLVAWARRRATS